MEQEISALHERNRRIERDKAWETSYERRALLTAATYITIGLYLQALGIKQAWLHASVPAAGFLLSTCTLSQIRRRFSALSATE